MVDKQRFEEPLLQVAHLDVEDIISSSTDWGGGNMDIFKIEKP